MKRDIDEQTGPRTTRRIYHSFPILPSKASSLLRTSSSRFYQAKLFAYEPRGLCCEKGNIQLATNHPLEALYELLTTPNDDAQHFRTNIRTYNNLFLLPLWLSNLILT
ncbi:hypothetical protein ACSBR2_001853 [Camellia fascicularis]